jgi:hypothetical protein
MNDMKFRHLMRLAAGLTDACLTFSLIKKY